MHSTYFGYSDKLSHFITCLGAAAWPILLSICWLQYSFPLEYSILKPNFTSNPTRSTAFWVCIVSEFLH